MPLADQDFGNSNEVHAQSTALVNPSDAFFFRIAGTCHGTGQLAEAIPPGTKISALVNQVQAGAGASLTGMKLNLGGTLPFAVLNKTYDGAVMVSGIPGHFHFTLNVNISGTGRVTFDVADVQVTAFGFSIPGTIVMESGAKALVGVAPVVQMRDLALPAVEGDVAKVLVKRTKNLDLTCAVDYTTLADTATKADFKPISGTLHFSAGQAVGKIKIPIKINSLKSGARQFKVRLSSPVAAILGDSKVTTVTITDP
ncbi:hypothetical protein BH18VER1_BH18VER1_21050 [soil metagenome]